MTTGFFAHTALCLGVSLAVLAAMPARAQIGEIIPMITTPSAVAVEDAPQETPAITVAMLYHRLIGRTPDYNAWAQHTDDYAAAPDLQKSVVQEREANKFRNIFTLTTLAEPVIVRRDIVISEYSPRNGGFSIDDFGDDSYFGYDFGGQHYAVVVPDLANHQWQPMEIDQAGMVDMTAQKTNRVLTVTLYIAPNFADARMPMPIDGKDYWLLSGTLQRLTLSEPGKAKPLFERTIAAAGLQLEHDKELINLYQHQR